MKRILACSLALLLVFALACSQADALTAASAPESMPASKAAPELPSELTPTPEPTPASKAGSRLPSVFTFASPEPSPGDGGVRRLGDLELEITDVCLTSYLDYYPILFFTLGIRNVGRKTLTEIPLSLFAQQDGEELVGGVGGGDDEALKPGGYTEFDFIYLAYTDADMVVWIELDDDPDAYGEWFFAFEDLEYRDMDLSAFVGEENDEEPSIYYDGLDYGDATCFDALEAYVFGPDYVTAITAVVGRRQCAEWAYGEYAEGDGNYFEMYYESGSPAEDVQDYVYYLLEYEGFIVLDTDIEFNESGQGVMAKPSAEEGMLVYLGLAWNEEALYLGVSRIEGELTYYATDQSLYYDFGEALPDGADLGELMGYRFGEDLVHSVQYVNGYRECLYWNEGVYDDDYGHYVEMICQGDDPRIDMICYINYLVDEQGFLSLSEDAAFDAVSGEYYLVKPSADEGMLLYVELAWYEDAFYFAISKIVGEFEYSGDTDVTDTEDIVYHTQEEAEEILTNYLITLTYTIQTDSGETDTVIVTEGRFGGGCMISYTVDEETTIIYADLEAYRVYIISPATKEAWYFDITADGLSEYQGFSDLMASLLFMPDDFDSSDLTYVGSESVCGRETQVYELIWEDYAFQYWIDQEYGVILKYWERLDGNEFFFETTQFLAGDVEASDLINLKGYTISGLEE